MTPLEVSTIMLKKHKIGQTNNGQIDAVRIQYCKS